MKSSLRSSRSMQDVELGDEPKTNGESSPITSFRTATFGRVLALAGLLACACACQAVDLGDGDRASAANVLPSGSNAETDSAVTDTSSTVTDRGDNVGNAPPGSGPGDTQQTDAGTSDGGADAQAPYVPCPPKGTPCVILPLGDSITAGWGGSNGGAYRAPLFHLALSKQQSITFVGGSSDGPNMVDNMAFPKGHEGHPGYTIDPGAGRNGIHSLTLPAIQKYHPHIVTLMIGTNDIATHFDLPNLPKRLGGDPNGTSLSLIDTILSADPNLLLVVAQIVPTTNDGLNVDVKAYNDAIPALVQKRASQGKHIMMVDMYGAFTANSKYKTDYMNDQLHPKDAGYAKMADVWYATIGPFLR